MASPSHSPTSLSRDTILSGSAAHFAVTYVINPAMTCGRHVWGRQPIAMRRGALNTMAAAREIFADHNADIKRLRADPKNPDACFPADPATVMISKAGEKIAIQSKMKYSQRAREVVNVVRALKSYGFKILPSILTREGSGDALYDPNFGIWWAGYGERNARGVGKQLALASGRNVIEVPVTHAAFYHLDTFLSFLPKGQVLLFKEAMTPETYNAICSFYPSDKRIELDRKSAHALAANLQYVQKQTPDSTLMTTVLMAKETAPKVVQKLEAWGYKVALLDIAALRHAGGGLHCANQRVADCSATPPHRVTNQFDTIEAQNVTARRKLYLWGHDGRAVRALGVRTNALLSARR